MLKKTRHKSWINVFSGKTQKKTNRRKLSDLLETEVEEEALIIHKVVAGATFQLCSNNFKMF